MSYRDLSVLTGGTTVFAACCLIFTTPVAMAQVQCGQQVGPNVIVGGIEGTTNYSTESISGVLHDAFSFGTTSCNVGNQNLLWREFSISSGNRHPAISQNLFRYKVVDGTGRFEQVGQSWLKHGFLALTQNLCCACNNPGSGYLLGVGCSDPYSSSRNGDQTGSGGLGPKWQVDATTGWFPRFGGNGGALGPAQPTPFTATTGRRLRVSHADLEPASTSSSTRYFAEAQYISQDDAAFGNKNNNASYRAVTITQTTQGTPPIVNFNAALASTTVRGEPGIMAWKALDSAVVVENVTTVESPNSAYGTTRSDAFSSACCTSARVIVAARTYDLGNGMWRYEYAVQNLNSERSIASFSVPLNGGNDSLVITNIGFRDVDYHSGDAENNYTNGNFNRDGADWPATVSSNQIKWETTPYAQNANANALRWGTMYNFRFDANVAPSTGRLTLGAWKVPGTLDTSANMPVPAPVPSNPCPADIAPPGGDGAVGVPDLLAVISSWGACPPGSCPADIAPPGGDGTVGVPDLLSVISNWGPCPN